MKIVREGQRDLSRPLARFQPPLDLLLGWDQDDDIALNGGLTGEHIPGCHVLVRQALGGAAPNTAFLDNDGTAAAPPLAAARQQNIHPCPLRGCAQKRAHRHLDAQLSGFEANADGSDGDPSRSLRGNSSLGVPDQWWTYRWAMMTTPGPPIPISPAHLPPRLLR